MIYSPLIPNPDEVAALLRSGKNVITPVGWLYPSEKQAAPMRAAALEGNATLHGTGIAPAGSAKNFRWCSPRWRPGEFRSCRGVFRPAHL